MKATRWSRWRLLLLAWAIASGIGTLVVWQLLESRAATWQRAQVANTNLAFTISDVLERTFDAADHSLRHAVTLLERNAARLAVDPGAGTLQAEDGHLLFGGAAGHGYGVLVALDAQGRTLVSSSLTPPIDRPFNDREYFTVHEHTVDAGLFIGPPFRSAYDNKLSMAMSRRWNLPDGSFGGIVVQTLKLSALHDLFSSFDLGPDSGINVFLQDGRVTMRFPYTSDQITQWPGGMIQFERFVQQGENGFTAVAADGVERLYVFRRLENYPVIVNVAQSRSSILSDWERNAVWIGSAMLMLMFACVALAVQAERSVRAHRRTAQRLAQTEHEMRMVIDSLPVLVAYWDDQFVNRMANTPHLNWLGLDPQQMRGRSAHDLVPEDLYHSIRPHMDAALAGETRSFEVEMPDVHGIKRHFVTTYIPDWDQTRVRGVFTLVTDMSERKAAEKALFEEKERFRIILESIKDGVITTDADGLIRYVNPAAAALTGWQLEEARGKPIEHIMATETPQRGKACTSLLREALQMRCAFNTKVEHILVSRTGDRIPIENSAAPIFDEHGELRGAVVVFHEVGQVRAIANKMTHLAQHDALTGLPNRRRLDQVGREALALARAESRRLAVLYLDLDGFKLVNDEYGHAMGDQLLVAVTRRLSARLRATDALYRQGGDEFVVLMDGIDAMEEAERLAGRLIECCRVPVRVAGKELSVTVSIGISIFPHDAHDLDALIQRADAAMYVAKNSGRNRYQCVDGQLSEPPEDDQNPQSAIRFSH